MGFNRHHDHFLFFWMVFFMTSAVTLSCLFLFPSVRHALRNSVLATGFFQSGAQYEEAPVPVRIFEDVTSDYPNADAILYMKQQHIVNGYSDGTFRPSLPMTRAELLKLVISALHIDPSPAIYGHCFKDVADGWFSQAACYAYSKGWVRGKGNGTFAPSDNVTAPEAFKIMLSAYRVPLLSDAPPEMKFSIDKNEWYAQYVWTAFARHLVEPDITNSQEKMVNYVNQPLTRSDAVFMLYQLMKDFPARTGMLPEPVSGKSQETH